MSFNWPARKNATLSSSSSKQYWCNSGKLQLWQWRIQVNKYQFWLPYWFWSIRFLITLSVLSVGGRNTDFNFFLKEICKSFLKIYYSVCHKKLFARYKLFCVSQGKHQRKINPSASRRFDTEPAKMHTH